MVSATGGDGTNDPFAADSLVKLVVEKWNLPLQIAQPDPSFSEEQKVGTEARYELKSLVRNVPAGREVLKFVYACHHVSEYAPPITLRRNGIDWKTQLMTLLHAALPVGDQLPCRATYGSKAATFMVILIHVGFDVYCSTGGTKMPRLTSADVATLATTLLPMIKATEGRAAADGGGGATAESSRPASDDASAPGADASMTPTAASHPLSEVSRRAASSAAAVGGGGATAGGSRPQSADASAPGAGASMTPPAPPHPMSEVPTAGASSRVSSAPQPYHIPIPSPGATAPLPMFAPSTVSRVRDHASQGAARVHGQRTTSAAASAERGRSVAEALARTGGGVDSNHPRHAARSAQGARMSAAFGEIPTPSEGCERPQPVFTPMRQPAARTGSGAQPMEQEDTEAFFTPLHQSSPDPRNPMLWDIPDDCPITVALQMTVVNTWYQSGGASLAKPREVALAEAALNTYQLVRSARPQSMNDDGAGVAGACAGGDGRAVGANLYGGATTQPGTAGARYPVAVPGGIHRREPDATGDRQAGSAQGHARGPSFQDRLRFNAYPPTTVAPSETEQQEYHRASLSHLPPPPAGVGIRQPPPGGPSDPDRDARLGYALRPTFNPDRTNRKATNFSADVEELLNTLARRVTTKCPSVGYMRGTIRVLNHLEILHPRPGSLRAILTAADIKYGTLKTLKRNKAYLTKWCSHALDSEPDFFGTVRRLKRAANTAQEAGLGNAAPTET